MKIFKITAGLYVNQIFLVLISLFLTLPLYNVARTKPMLFSTITALVYLVFMYSHSWNMGYRDARKIPGFEPSIKTPVKASIYTAIIPVILLIIRIFLPTAFALDILFLKGEADFILLDCRTVGVPDFMLRLWYFPFAGFVPTGNFVAYILQILVLPVIIFGGYYVGIKRFSIREFLHNKIMFEDKNEKK